MERFRNEVKIWGLILSMTFVLFAVSCTESENNQVGSEDDFENLSPTGKILAGKHYLYPLNDDGDLYSIEKRESSYDFFIRLFVEFGGQKVVCQFRSTELRFEETDDEPHVRFGWEGYSNETNLNAIINNEILAVVLCLPEDVKFYFEDNHRVDTVYVEAECDCDDSYY